MGKIKLRDEPSTIGNRVKSARMLSGHTRKSFANSSSISVATLRAWEEPTPERSGLSSKGAKRLINALNIMGIYCTESWLIYGTGPGPNIIGVSQKEFIEDTKVGWGEEESILKDIDSFKQNNHDPIVAIVTDGSMLPKFSYGDYVGGSKVYDSEIEKLVGLNCIIGLNEKTVIRRISSVNKSKYTLTALNQDLSSSDVVITNAVLKFAAEITWHRWRKKIQDITV